MIKKEKRQAKDSRIVLKGSLVDDTISLIAHRGLPSEFPENTLPGIQAALEAGAHSVEIDIQFTCDGVPILYHDENMQRLSGIDQSILNLQSSELKNYSVNLPDTEILQKTSAAIATLEELVTLISSWPQCHFFIELKRHSVERYGATFCVEKILNIIKPVASSCIPISFNHKAMFVFREHCDLPVGWVIREWNEAQHKIADELKPEYLFCNINKLPENKDELWEGSWNWVLYSIDDIKTLKKYRKQGFKFLETNKLRQLNEK